MRIALVADLHGNMPAVEALEGDLQNRRVDKVICLGDVIGKGPCNDKTYDWAVSRCDVILLGNWDEGVGRRHYARDKFYYEQLGPKRMRGLLRFKKEHHLLLSGRKIRLVHGRPFTRELVSPHGDAEKLEELFLPDFDVVGYADTHRQALRTMRGILFNTGSVGNGLGCPKVQYAILEGEENNPGGPFDIRFVQLDYDVERAVRDALEQPDLPGAEYYIQEIRTGKYSRPHRPM